MKVNVHNELLTFHYILAKANMISRNNKSA